MIYVRKENTKRRVKTLVSAPGTVRMRSTMRLSGRRRIIRRRKITLGFILTIFLFVFIIVMLHQPFMRITRIVVTAPHGISNGAVISMVRHSLIGSYANLVPYSSILFLNNTSIRSAILQNEPTIAAVSIGRKGLGTINVVLEPRTALSRWCGTFASSTPSNILSKDTRTIGNGSCYLFDSGGFLYRKIATTASSTVDDLHTHIAIGSVAPLFPYTIYAPLVATGTPYLNTIAGESSLPHIFDLARNIRVFHATVSAIVLRGDEVDLFLNDGTRITYVRGGERNAFYLLSSVAKDISLSDGSLQYVDLRFARKVYFKRR